MAVTKKPEPLGEWTLDRWTMLDRVPSPRREMSEREACEAIEAFAEAVRRRAEVVRNQVADGVYDEPSRKTLESGIEALNDGLVYLTEHWPMEDE